MEKDEVIDEDLIVYGNISGKDGVRYSLAVKGDLNCWNLNCRNLNCWNLNCGNLDCWNLDCEDLNCWNLDCGDLNCRNLNCRNLNCWDLNCRNLNCWDLNCGDLDCWNLDCGDLSFYAVCIAYNSLKCKSWKARRDNHVIKCLDGKIEIIPDKKVCEKCGQEIKEEKLTQ